MNSQTELDFAIIGGGIAGIYTGWRLATAGGSDAEKLRGCNGGKKLKIKVYEQSQRIGGRLLSAQPPGMGDVVCELGGMRYVSAQALVKSLIENELKLSSHLQVVSCDRNLAFLRGHRMRLADTVEPLNLPYGLHWSEQQFLEDPKNAPADLLGWAVGKLLPEVTKLHGAELESYLQQATIDNTPLFEHGFWNLVARTMSLEAYQVARAMVGYDSLGANANAVDLIMEYFNFTPGVNYYMLDNGYDAVPWELQSRFQDAGGEIELGACLKSFDAVKLASGDQGVELRFATGGTIRARNIVLALPQRAIRLLDATGPVLDPVKSPDMQDLLNSVQPIALYKLFIRYPEPWWEKLGAGIGRSLTDGPIRQCYYWPKDTDQGPATGMSTLIMAYNDETSVDFWRGLSLKNARHAQKSSGSSRYASVSFFEPKISEQAAGPVSKNPYSPRLLQNWKDHKAPKALVREMHNQLVRMHRYPNAPEPIDAAFMDWSQDPYGAGVHFWNTGYRSWEVLEDMTQPVADFPCYVCGEAWSTNQTWVEGCLQTAEMVLQKRLGLSKPAWLEEPAAVAKGAGTNA